MSAKGPDRAVATAGVASGWMVRIGDDTRHAFYAGRQPGQLFKGAFDTAAVQRVFRFAPDAAGAHRFQRPSDAFQVLTILAEAGLQASVRVSGTGLPGAPETIEAGFLVEVAGALPLLVQYVTDEGRMSLRRERAAIMDFDLAMRRACEIEDARRVHARLVPACGR